MSMIEKYFEKRLPKITQRFAKGFITTKWYWNIYKINTKHKNIYIAEGIRFGIKLETVIFEKTKHGIRELISIYGEPRRGRFYKDVDIDESVFEEIDNLILELYKKADEYNSYVERGLEPSDAKVKSLYNEVKRKLPPYLRKHLPRLDWILLYFCGLNSRAITARLWR